MKKFILLILAVFCMNRSWAQCDTLTMPDTLYACPGSVDTLHVILSGTDSVISYAWTPATGLSSTTVLDPTLTVGASGYYHITATTTQPNLVVNGNFSAGDTGFTSSYTYVSCADCDDPGDIEIGTNPHYFNSGWASMGDHTTGTGDMLCVDGSTTSSSVSFWCESIAVTPHTNYTYSMWAATVATPAPTVRIKINGVTVGTFSPTGTASWTHYYFTWNSSTYTSADICLTDLSTVYDGNDFAVDDISFTQQCTTTDSIYVSVVPLDTTYSTTDTAVCASITSVFLSAPSGLTYYWSSGVTTPTITVAAPGTYWNIVTETGCSVKADTIIISTLPTPSTPVLASNSPICYGGALELAAVDTSGSSYNWSGPGAFTSAAENPIISPAYTSASGNYTVVASLPSGCTAENSIYVFVDSCNSLSLQDTLTACATSVDTLHATVSGTDSILSILWSPVTGLSSSTVLDPALTVSTSGWYDVTVESITPGSPSLIANGDFSTGNTGFTSSYTYDPTSPIPAATTPGDYMISTNPYLYATSWPSMGDHTTGTGNMLILDGSLTAGTSFWCESVSVTPNTNYIFSVWSSLLAAPLPSINLVINGTSISTFAPSTTVASWTQYRVVWNSGTATTASICLGDLDDADLGNDFAVDDISFTAISTITDSIYVNAVPKPLVDLGPDTSFCSGGTVTLRSSDTYTGATYLWSTGSLAPSIIASTTGAYWLDVTVNGCTGSDTVNVTVIPTPPASEPNSNATGTILCSGKILSLTDTVPDFTFRPLSYNWTGPEGFTSTLQNPTIFPAYIGMTGYYSVTATYMGCTSPVASVPVYIDSTPVTPAVSSNAPVCQGDTLLLFSSSATAGVFYSWTGPGGFTSTMQNIVIPAANSSDSGQYTITVTNGSCSSDAFINASVDPIPVINLLSAEPPVICSGGNTTLTSSFIPSALGVYNWTGPDGYTSNIENAPITGATTAATGIYSVTETVAICTSEVYTVALTVDSTPAHPYITTNSPVCQGDTLYFYGADSTAGVSYSWSNPEDSIFSTLQNTFITDVPLADTGTYEIKVTLGNCADSAFATINVTTTPSFTPTSNSPVCSGDTLLLYANGPAGASYTWSGPYPYAFATYRFAADPVITNVTTESSGIYTVTALYNGCNIPEEDTVLIKQTPAVPSVSWLTYCQYYPAPPLMADDTSIQWYSADTISTADVRSVPTPQTDTVGSTFYYLTQTVAGCQSALDSIQIVVYPTPSVTVTPADTSVCPHTTYLISATSTAASTSYHWMPYMYISDSNTASVNVDPETDVIYTVVASNQYGCADTATSSVHVYPAAVLTLGDSITLYPGQSYTITPSTNCVTFSWFPPAGLSDPSLPNPVADPAVNTRYTVYGQTEYGCSAVDSISIYVSANTLIALPNAFTPGNGVNSEFKIIKNGEATLNYFRIFNRWGQKVFETNNIDQGWDGTFNGTPQAFDVFVYEIQAVTSNGQTFTLHGNVTLVR